MQTIKNKCKSMLMLCMVLAVIFSIFNPIMFASAYNVYTTQVTVDDTAWQIVAGVVKEDVGAFSDNGIPSEGRRFPSSELSKLAKNNGSPTAAASLLETLNIDDVRKEVTDSQSGNYVMTYPGKPGTKWAGTAHESSTANDMERATIVKDTVLYDLNAAYDFIFGAKKTTSLANYRSNLVSLLNAVGSHGTVNNCTISTVSANEIKVADPSMSASDYVKITNKDGTSAVFAYRIPKGYIAVGNYSVPNKLKTLQASEDATYITWGEFAYEAFVNYLSDESLVITTQNVYSGTPGSFEKTVVGLLSSFNDFIASALGLWNLDNLIFNDGIRGGSTYVGGIFPQSWETIIWTLFYIIEIVAIIFLSFVIVNNILRRATATVNPYVRADLMEQLKNIGLAILALILLPIIFRLLISLSGSLTGVFSAAIGDASATERFKTLAQNSGTLGGCLMQLCYLLALLYFNFFYTIRAIIIAALIVMAPLFIMFYAYSENGKRMAMGWVQEFAANLFIQPMQALALSLILLLPSSSRGIENLILIYALIPFTQTLRSLIFGQSGGLIHQAAQKGQSVASNIGKVAASAVGGAAFGAGKAAVAGAKGASTGNSAGSGFGDNATEKQLPEEIKSKDAVKTPKERVKEWASNTEAGKKVAAIKASPPGQVASGIAGTVGGGLGATGGVALAGLGGAASRLGARNLGKDMTQLGKNVAQSGGAMMHSGMKTIGDAIPVKQNLIPRNEDKGNDTLEKGTSGFSTADGGMSYEIPKDELPAHGFDKLNANSNSGLDYLTTDTGYRGDVNGIPNFDGSISSKVNPSDSANFAAMSNTFAHGTEAEKEALRRSGFDHVAPQMKDGKATGKFAVSTNGNFAKANGFNPTLNENGDLSIKQSVGTAGTPVYRTPDVSKVMNPESYQRELNGQRGMVSTGAVLSGVSMTPQTVDCSSGPAVIPSSGGIVSATPQVDDSVQVVYDAGVIGSDSSGAPVYNVSSPMSMPDRENLVQAEAMWNSGSEKDRSFLQAAGYSNIQRGSNGQMNVTYNKNAANSLGGSISQNNGQVVMQGNNSAVSTTINLNGRNMQTEARKTKIRIPKQNYGLPN